MHDDVVPVTSLTDLYDEYLCLKKHAADDADTDVPFGSNLMHTIFLEEYAKGCDIIIHDPYVDPGEDLLVNRITNSAEEMKLVATPDQKKFIVLMW